MSATQTGGSKLRRSLVAKALSAAWRRADDLFEPVDAISLVFLRVSFGVIMLVEVWRFWDHG